MKELKNKNIMVLGKSAMDRVNELWASDEEQRIMIETLKDGYVERAGEARGAGCSELHIEQIKRETQAAITKCCNKRKALIAEIEKIVIVRRG